MAICAPTVLARATTAWNGTEQLRLGHTRNVLRLPTVGGVAVTMPGAVTARPAGAAAKARLRARWRRKPSNWSAVSRGEEVATIPCATGAGAVTVVVRSRKGEDCPKVVAADCGTRRYSTESTADRLAANVTHPESAAGSIVVSAPTASATWWEASAALQGSSAGPAGLLLQAAAGRIADHISRCTAWRRFLPNVRTGVPRVMLTLRR